VADFNLPHHMNFAKVFGIRKLRRVSGLSCGAGVVCVILSLAVVI